MVSEFTIGRRDRRDTDFPILINARRESVFRVMERSFHTLLAAASGGNFDVDITPGATIIPDSDYSTVVFHMNSIKLLPRVDVDSRASKYYVGDRLGARAGSSSIY